MTSSCSTLHYSNLLYSTLIYSTLLFTSLLYSTLIYSTLLFTSLLYSTIIYSTLLFTIFFLQHALIEHTQTISTFLFYLPLSLSVCLTVSMWFSAIFLLSILLSFSSYFSPSFSLYSFAWFSVFFHSLSFYLLHSDYLRLSVLLYTILYSVCIYINPSVCFSLVFLMCVLLSLTLFL